MDETITKSLEHAPSLVAIIVILYMVGKHLDKRDTANTHRTREFLDAIRDMHAENMEAREISRQVIERSTVEATNSTNALREVTLAIRDLISRK